MENEENNLPIDSPFIDDEIIDISEAESHPPFIEIHSVIRLFHY